MVTDSVIRIVFCESKGKLFSIKICRWVDELQISGKKRTKIPMSIPGDSKLGRSVKVDQAQGLGRRRRFLDKNLEGYGWGSA